MSANAEAHQCISLLGSVCEWQHPSPLPSARSLTPSLHPSAFCFNVQWTISAGHNIADMRLIYPLQYTEWCYYRKINAGHPSNSHPPLRPIVVLRGWTGCTHICSHNTNADLAVREWAREGKRGRQGERERERESEAVKERGCGEIADSVVYQSFIKPTVSRATSGCLVGASRAGGAPAEEELRLMWTGHDNVYG